MNLVVSGCQCKARGEIVVPYIYRLQGRQALSLQVIYQTLGRIKGRPIRVGYRDNGARLTTRVKKDN